MLDGAGAGVLEAGTVVLAIGRGWRLDAPLKLFWRLAAPLKLS